MIDPFRKPWEVGPPDLRYARPAHVFSVIWPAIKLYIQEKDHRRIYDAVFQVLHDAGVEIVTDEERERYGLPPRGPGGWTRQDLAAMELAINRAMLSQPGASASIFDMLPQKKD